MSNYQPLSQVIDLTDLPDEINWMTSGLSSLLSNVYLIDYQHFSDSYKNSSNILVTLRVEQGVNLEEPVSGLILALNPAFDPSSGVSSSQFVLKCRVDYGLIGIINSFTSNYSSFTNLELLQVAS